MRLSVTHIDTATIILNINGFRIMTDPVLDPPGKWYHFGWGSVSRKTGTPALTATEIGPIDLVLLSHHQHQDNLDRAGRAFLEQVPQIISTRSAAKALPRVTGLAPWESISIKTDLVPGLKITATPAQHHPSWVPGFFAGPVIGFMLEWEGQEQGALYISGDTVYFKGISEIARRYKVDVAILHLGGVQFRYLTGLGRYTFNAAEAIRTATELNARRIIPIHFKGWSHFKDDHEKARQLFDQSDLGDKTIWLESGVEFLL
ncbi:MAG: MBL fold metallo-hydrolase [Bacteroidota bacterium]